MNRQETNMEQFDELNSYHLRTNLHAAKLSASLMPTVEIFMAFGLAGAIVVGGSMVTNSTIEAGFLVAFTLWIQRFFDPIRSMTQQFTQLQRAMASGARIFDLLDVEPDLFDSDNASELPTIKGAVRYNHVSFEYTEGKPVINDVELSIEPGQTVALVGKTGAGKTTMVALLSRFFDVSDGSLTIDDHDVREVTRDSLAKQMGIVLQEPFQFSGSIVGNIRYNHAKATQKDIEIAAKAVGIHDHIMSLPEGYKTEMEERGGNMSLGQRQLISFARALVADPRIIILDEATANVDTQTEQLIQSAIGTLLVEMGDHDQLIGLGGLYAKQYELHQALAVSGVQREDAPENEFDDELPEDAQSPATA